MSQKAIKKTKTLLLVLLGISAITMLTIWGCGTSDYDNPKTEYLSGNAENSVIEVADLRKWDANEGVLDDGLYKTDKGERVVLIDAMDDTASMSKYYLGTGHIPGALLNRSHENNNIAIVRNDGMIAEDHGAPDGPAMDGVIQKLGITKDAVVVITTGKMDAAAASPVLYEFCASRMYWTMKYWGFSNAKVKVLNGYNGAWKAAGYPLVKTAAPAVQPSTLSVRDLAGPDLHLRTTIGEMIALVDSGKANKLAGDVIILDMRQPLQGFSADEGCAVAIPSGGGAAFDGYVKGAVQIPTTSPITTFKILDYIYAADGVTKLGLKYKSKEDLKAAFDAAGIKGDKPIVVYCNSGSSAMRYWFPLYAILGYDISIFDASMNTWLTMSAFQPGDLTYVRNDSTSPNFNASNFFYWDAAAKVFKDAKTDLPVAAGTIVLGGNMGGDLTWDTVTRSERVTFRPTSTINSNKITGGTQTYNALGAAGVAAVDQDWRPITQTSTYRGDGSEAEKADAAYYNSTGTTTSGAAAAGGKTGGGC